MDIIQIQNLDVNYEFVNALSNITFNVHQGEFLGIIGPNGGGKTTLIKTILGLIKPTKGQVELAKDVILGYVPQVTTFDRSFPISVGEVILTGHLPRNSKLFYKPNAEVKTHVKNVMTRLGIEDLFDRQIGELSGGQTQKVLIARALMNHPTVLILDEPTAGVDSDSRKTIYEMLKKLNETMTILIISHHTEQLMPFLDRVIYINKKTHIHSEPYIKKENQLDDNCCPIDWLIQGERIEQ